MIDMQNTQPTYALSLKKVGINDLILPIAIVQENTDLQHTIANISVATSLDENHKGTHMSRLIESILSSCEKIEQDTLKNIAENLLIRLDAKNAYISFDFPYFIEKKSPHTQKIAPVSYSCKLTYQINENKHSYSYTLKIPVMTLCPCSKAISQYGAHSQRAFIDLSVTINEHIHFEKLIKIAENTASSPIYTLLKREDEKCITEQAYDNPTFVEDVARNLAQEIHKLKEIHSFTLSVESIESIHNHNAFASIDSSSFL